MIGRVSAPSILLVRRVAERADWNARGDSTSQDRRIS